MSVESADLPPDPDSEGCLCIVASYSDLAPAVGPMAAEAAKRIMMSPALGDFIELRFTDIGSRPEHTGEHGDEAMAVLTDQAVAVLTDQLIRPASGVGRNFFALVVADTSAATAERLLGDCAAVPAVAGLPIRFRGIASSDDRPLAPGRGHGVEMVVSPAGSWSREAFVDELRSYGEELLRYFATGHDPGIGRDELDVLRSGNGQETVTLAEAVAAPDILTPQPVTAQPPDPRVPEGGQAAEEAPRKLEQPTRPPEAASRAPEPSPAAEATSRELVPAQPPQSRRLGRPMARWRRGHEAEYEAGAAETRASGLVYLITGDISSDHTAWHMGRSMLLDIDDKIAATPPFAYKVRALQIGQDSVQGALRAAGQLSRRDIKKPVSDADFAAVLGSIRTMLKIDRAAIQAPARPMAWPAVVFFAADPPLADTATAEVYRELAQEATIIWVVPRDSADLMAPVFAEAPDTMLLIYHQEVGGEVVSLLTSSNRIREANAPLPSAGPARAACSGFPT